MPVFYTTLAVLWLIAVSCWRCCHCNLWSLTFSQNLHENPENIMPSNQMITIHTYKPYQTYSLCPDIHCFVSLALLSWKFSFNKTVLSLFCPSVSLHHQKYFCFQSMLISGICLARACSSGLARWQCRQPQLCSTLFIDSRCKKNPHWL